ncbi:MAG TPA: UDP-N-acetylglucosamine 2-epimerase (non-hydrolyzing), partial [Ignavibacteria bacterium]|nr:UDP-N-acetylglucosamine 2-epimerase (non-hydrolyzing) [Ignavibacteria bacterium]
MKNNLKILLLLGTRPEIIKNYSVVMALKQQKVSHKVVYTNQHNDYLMNELIFDELTYKPDKILMKKFRIGECIDNLIKYILKEKFSLIIVNGDTTTSLVGTVAGIQTDISIAHIEAGLRSFDKYMYEERNRIYADFSAHYLFTYTKYQKELLLKTEGLRGKIYNVGNTTVDVIYSKQKVIKEYAKQFKTDFGDYIFVTMHRKEFTDSQHRMKTFIDVLRKIKSTTGLKIIFPLHPRTKSYLEKYNLKTELTSGISLISPVSFLHSVSLQKSARLILTDSGCVQEEACILKTPCVTIRDNTERNETLKNNANILAGFKTDKKLKRVDIFLKKKKNFNKVYRKTRACNRVISILKKKKN